jgi:prepilin-type N-terminal cleavage/methylation domain-containing protein
MKFMNHKKAFTLMELIMTIVVLSIISIPASFVLSQYMASFSFNEGVNIALQLSRIELENLYNQDYNNITSANFTDYQGFGYDLKRVVLYKEGGSLTGESLKEIRIKVYPSGSNESLSEYITYRAENVVF